MTSRAKLFIQIYYNEIGAYTHDENKIVQNRNEWREIN
jgi:hypothetical protein